MGVQKPIMVTLSVKFSVMVNDIRAGTFSFWVVGRTELHVSLDSMSTPKNERWTIDAQLEGVGVFA